METVFSKYEWIGKNYGNWDVHSFLKKGEVIHIQKGCPQEDKYKHDTKNWKQVQ